MSSLSPPAHAYRRHNACHPKNYSHQSHPWNVRLPRSAYGKTKVGEVVAWSGSSPALFVFQASPLWPARPAASAALAACPRASRTLYACQLGVSVGKQFSDGGIAKSFAETPASKSRSPNLLLFTSDDLGMQVGCYGDPLPARPTTTSWPHKACESRQPMLRSPRAVRREAVCSLACIRIRTVRSGRPPSLDMPQIPALRFSPICSRRPDIARRCSARYTSPLNQLSISILHLSTRTLI